MSDPGVVAALATGASAGLVSASHCAAMCGPIASAACARSGSAGASPRYQLGRIVGYGFTGMLAGQLGHALLALHQAEVARWALRGLFVLSCLWLARYLWKPRRPDVPLSRLSPKRSKPLWLQSLARLLPREPVTLGALTALLPCGALYVALMLSAGSGSAARGASLMIGFAFTSGLALTVASLSLRLRVLAPGRGLARGLSLVMVALACASFVQPIAARPDAAAKPSAQAGEASCH